MAVVVDTAPRATERSWLDRSLSVIADVHAGEGLGALLLAVNVFVLLASYYVLKTVRESLILSEGGAEVKSYSAAGQALLLLALVPAYGAIASRINRVQLISAVTLFFSSHLLIFYGLGIAGVHIGVAFFLWIGIFNLVVIAQFWAFANDVYDTDRGKRLFPVVGLGSSLGAWVGAASAGALFTAAGPYRLMLLAGVGLVACVFLTLHIDRRERRSGDGASETHAEPSMSRSGGFQLVFSQRYLLLIALLILVLNIVNTVGEYLLGRMVVADAAAKIASGNAGGLTEDVLIGRFYGNFLAAANLVGFLFQLLLASRLFKWVGVRGTLYVLPIIASFSYGMMAIVPVLAVVTAAKILENGTDYSIQNTARHALFLPTSREAKYKAKQAIDGFFWRMGDLIQAAIVFAGTSLALETSGFALINLAFVAVWIALVMAIGAEHRKLSPG
jgi:ATP:ADP antiporter, AAA family